MTRKKSINKATKQEFTDRTGTFKFWERAGLGMSGGSWSPGPPAKPRRKPDRKTLQMLEKSAKLIAKGKPDWPVALAWWPKLPRQKQLAYLKVRKSKHRGIHDALIQKYTPV